MAKRARLISKEDGAIETSESKYNGKYLLGNLLVCGDCGASYRRRTEREGMVVSFYLLSLAIKSLPIGTTYAIWTGIGALGAVLMGIFLFNEPVNISRIVFLCLILVGILGLKLTSV